MDDFIQLIQAVKEIGIPTVSFCLSIWLVVYIVKSLRNELVSVGDVLRQAMTDWKIFMTMVKTEHDNQKECHSKMIEEQQNISSDLANLSHDRKKEGESK